MVPAHKISAYSLRQSGWGDSWCMQRDYSALLLSTGHPFKDGRWTGQDDDNFHVYKEMERPALGAPASVWAFPPNDPEATVLTEFRWKPALSRTYDSVLLPDSTLDLPVIVDPDFGDLALYLNAQGTAFIRRARPGNPAVSVGQYLVELRELPSIPHFLKPKAKRFCDLGSEYLNVEFGWTPFVKDLLKIHDLQKSLDKKLKQLVRDNGLNIRRRDKQKVTTSSLTLAEGILEVPFGHLGDDLIGGTALLDGYHTIGPFGGGVPASVPGSVDYTLTEEQTLTEWNCGTFRYYVPNIGSSEWTEKAVKTLYGANLSPQTLYAVYPWTWLADWFFNVGDILSNLETNAVSNETLTNAYSMFTKQVDRKVNARIQWFDWDRTDSGPFVLPAGSAELVHTISRVNKTRRQASPFGFGLKRSEFTPSQWAILGALAASKAKVPKIRLDEPRISAKDAILRSLSLNH